MGVGPSILGTESFLLTWHECSQSTQTAKTQAWDLAILTNLCIRKDLPPHSPWWEILLSPKMIFPLGRAGLHHEPPASVTGQRATVTPSKSGYHNALPSESFFSSNAEQVPIKTSNTRAPCTPAQITTSTQPPRSGHCCMAPRQQPCRSH